MKKTNVIIFACALFVLVITISSIIFFMPSEKPSTDSTLFISKDNDTIEKIQRVNTSNSEIKNTSLVSQKVVSGNNNSIIINLSDYVDNFELAGENTSSIFTANDKRTQEYITGFRNIINKEILDNPNISSKEKQKLLWDLYHGKNWKGNDNAFKAVISDALLSIDLSDILPEIIDTYQKSLSIGDRDIDERTNLIRIISNNSKNNTDKVNSLYLKQIRSANTEREIQELSSFSLMQYIKEGNADTLEKNIDEIMNIADSDKIKASIYVDTILISSIDSPKNTDVVFEKLFDRPLGSFTKTALNNSLLFQLSEDRNFNITDIKPHNLEKVKNYIKKQNLSGKDWEVVNYRIEQVLQGNKD